MKKIIIPVILATILFLVVMFLSNIKPDPVMVDLLERDNWLNTKQKVSEKMAYSLIKLINDAEKENICLVVTSGYRTADEQAKIKNKYGGLAADVGESEHQTGLAVDFAACPMGDGISHQMRNDGVERPELKNPFNTLPEYAWLVKNAGNYGFKQSYDNEPWHWKYIK